VPSTTLFEELEHSRGPVAKKPKPVQKRYSKLDPLQGKPGIIQHTQIIRILERTLNEQSISAKARKKIASHRTRLGDASWRLDRVLNKVNEDIWVNVVKAQLRGFIKGIEHQQPNGRWLLAEWATAIRKDVDEIERLFVVCKFVDEFGNSDLQYRNGIPVHDINLEVKTAPPPAIDAELIKELRGSQAGTDVMEKMLKVMEAQARIQAKQAGVDVSDLLGDEEQPEEPAGSEPEESE
jgi:hypothetical protein